MKALHFCDNADLVKEDGFFKVFFLVSSEQYILMYYLKK